MKLKSLVMGLVVAAVVPVAAVAQTPPSTSDKENGARACKALLAKMGEATFKSTYGTNTDKSNAMGKCVSAWARAEQKNRQEATAACTAEQQDANFAAAHGGKTFAEFYGAGKKGVNALQRCIQSKRAAATAEERNDTVNAARQCKAERKTIGAGPFSEKYGTNANKSNAFGKCVSKLAAE